MNLKTILALKSVATYPTVNDSKKLNLGCFLRGSIIMASSKAIWRNNVGKNR